jgi:hypothetical protein
MAIPRQAGGRRTARHSAAAPISGAHRGIRRWLALFSTAAVFGLLGTLAVAPKPSAVTETLAVDSLAGDPQSVSVAPDASAPAVEHESYVATTGAQTLVAGGTNEDWAKLVLIDGGFPLTEANVTVMLRWMR